MTIKHAARFWSKVDVRSENECWDWQAGLFSSGYGCFSLDGKNERAHRIAYSLVNGPIPEGDSPSDHCVLHHCDRPSCCNPAHLFLGSQIDNVRDCVDKGRQRRGEDHGNAKLSDKQVADIRETYAAGGVTYRGLAAKYGVHFTHIGYIVKEKFRISGSNSGEAVA